MKEVLISIQPRHCENIASGKKTVEIRRTRPKCDAPFRCYIYCTKKEFAARKKNGEWWRAEKNCLMMPIGSTQLSGKIIGEFVCDKIGQIRFDDDGDLLYEPSLAGCSPCLSLGELQSYIGVNNVGYGWHISDLIIYNVPRELREFGKPLKGVYCTDHKEKGCDRGCVSFGCSDYYCKDYWDWATGVSLPPQSWCYVEEV